MIRAFCCRWRSRACFALLFAASLTYGLISQAVAQSAVWSSQTPVGDKSESYELSGTVVNSVTAEPIAHARVQLSAGDGSHRVALADNRGHFMFDGLSRGQASVSADKPGFFPQRWQYSWPLGATVQIGPSTPPVLVQLYPQAVIFGRISDASGEPIEGIPVRAIYVGIVNGSKRWTIHASTETDQDGGFRFAYLPFGSFYIAAGPGSQYTLSVAGAANAREEILPQVFYPGVSEMTSASAIELTPGEQFEANLTLTPEPVFQVSGTISGYPKEGIGDLLLTKTSEDSPPSNVQLDAQSGTFRAKVPAGSYKLRGMAEGVSWLPVNDAPLIVNSDAGGIHMALVPAASIPVSVRLEPTQSSSLELGVANGVNLVPARISLTSGTGSLQPRGYWASPRPDGSLLIPGVEPGVYSLSVVANPQWWVLSARCGGRDLLREDIIIIPGAQVPPIEIVMRDDAASLTGTVSLSEPRSMAMVLLVPQQGSRNEVKMVIALPAGEFQFRGVAPGVYNVLAFDSVDGLEYTNPEALSTYLTKASPVTLRPNGTANVALSLIRRER